MVEFGVAMVMQYIPGRGLDRAMREDGLFAPERAEAILADITAALESIGATGTRLIDTRPRHGSMGASIAFLHPADMGGVLTELVESAGAGAPG